MIALRPTPPARMRGFSLAELMISVTIGMLILAGMVTLFVNNSRAQAEIEKANRQVENGRFGIELLAADLRNAGYYGQFDPSALSVPAALPNPCTLTLAAVREGLSFPVQGYDNPGTSLSCLTDIKDNTDVIVVHRTRTCVAGVGTCDETSVGGPFFQASGCNNLYELGSGDVANYYKLDVDTSSLTLHDFTCTALANSGNLAEIRRYETHIYYIANNDNAGDAIPTLKRAELSSSGSALTMTVVPLVEGIENMQIEYGLDSGGTGAPTSYSAAPSGAAAWQTVVALKLHLLARNTEVSPSHTDNKSYVLGTNAAGAANTIAAANDHYKRHVFEAVVTLPNPAGRRMP